MDWRRVFHEKPGLTVQRLLKIFLLRADRKLACAKLFFARLRHGNGFVLRDVQGSKMFLNLADRGISADLLFRGKREDAATDIFQQWLKPGLVVVDIGANIGYYALMEAKAVGRKGKVYAIEPVDANVALLRKNIEANGYGNVDVFGMAIGNEDGVKEINLSKQSNLHAFGNNFNLDQSGKRKAVQMRTLDNFLEGKRKPDVVRMDVEGYEFEILKGMERTMKENSSLMLFIEVHANFLGKGKTVDFLKMLKRMGVRDCTVVKDVTDILKFSEKILSKDVLPERGVFEASIDEMIANERFHSAVYQLFARK